MLFQEHVHLISKIDHVILCTPPPLPFPIGELAIKWNFEKWGFENMSFSCGDFKKRGSNFFLGGRDCFVKWLLKSRSLETFNYQEGWEFQKTSLLYHVSGKHAQGQYRV